MLMIFVWAVVRLELQRVKVCLSSHNQQVVELGFELDLTPKPVPLTTTPPCLTDLDLGFCSFICWPQSLGELLRFLGLQSLHW